MLAPGGAPFVDAPSPIRVVSTEGVWGVAMVDGSAVGEAVTSEVAASGPLGSVPTAAVGGDDTAGGPSLSVGSDVSGEVGDRRPGRKTFVVGAGLVGEASMTALIVGRRFVAAAGLGDEVGVAAGRVAAATGVARQAGGALGADDANTTEGTAGALSPAASAASRRAPQASTTKIAKSRAPPMVAGPTRFA